MQFWGAARLITKTPIQVLSGEISKISKNNYFEEHLETSTSKLYLKKTPTQVFSCEFCELFANTFFVKDPKTTGSKTALIKLQAKRPEGM